LVSRPTYEAEKEAIAAQGKAEENQKLTQQKLDLSLRSQDRLAGEVLAFGIVLGQIKDSGNLGMKEVAAAVKQLAQANMQAGNVSNKDLCARTFDLTKNLRAMEAEFQNRRTGQTMIDDQFRSVETMKFERVYANCYFSTVNL
jgi:hypothetical protein